MLSIQRGNCHLSQKAVSPAMLSYFSISMDVDLSKNHYEHSSLKNVRVVKIPGSISCMRTENLLRSMNNGTGCNFLN